MNTLNSRQLDIANAFAAAIADLVLDVVEDAVDDATDDLLAGGEQLIETTLDDEDEEGSENDAEDLPDANALADLILSRVMGILHARRTQVADWTALRAAFPRS